MHKKPYADKQQSFVQAERVIGKSLPFNLEAERSVLGSVLLNDEHFQGVVELLSQTDFYLPAHQIIFQTMVNIAQSHRRIDFITLQDELTKTDQLQAIGGVVYLFSLQEEIPLAGLITQHARLIKEKAVLRDLITSATAIISNCYAQNDREIEAVLDEAEKTIFQISQKRAQNNFVQLNIWLKKTFQHLSEMKGHSAGITGIPAGYKKLDEMTSGFQKGDLVVLAARPSMGKTALALNIAQYAAQQQLTVGFLSLEMSADQLVLRMLSSRAGIPYHRIRNAMLNSDEWVHLMKVAGELSEQKLFIDDTALQTVMDIRAKARKLKIEHNLQLLVIDYLQLLQAFRRFENRHQEVSEISRSLKALAKELGIPIIALSQLSRAVDSRLDKRPLLSDLRESGAIEQDADLIMFLYRDVVYNAETENEALAEIIIGKQRNGPTGTVYLNYHRELMLFEDFDAA